VTRTTGQKPGDVVQRFVDAVADYRQPRAVDLDMLVQFGEQSVLLRVRSGVLVSCDQNLPPLQSWDVAIKADEDVWLAFWQAVPEPGWHDILALRKRAMMRIEGRLQPLMANLQYVKDLLAAPRFRQVRS